MSRQHHIAAFAPVMFSDAIAAKAYALDNVFSVNPAMPVLFRTESREVYVCRFGKPVTCDKVVSEDAFERRIRPFFEKAVREGICMSQDLSQCISDVDKQEIFLSRREDDENVIDGLDDSKEPIAFVLATASETQDGQSVDIARRTVAINPELMGNVGTVLLIQRGEHVIPSRWENSNKNKKILGNCLCLLPFPKDVTSVKTLTLTEIEEILGTEYADFSKCFPDAGSYRAKEGQVSKQVPAQVKWDVIKGLARTWWQGSALTESGDSPSHAPSWQRTMIHTDYVRGYQPKGEEQKYINKQNALDRRDAWDQTGIVIKDLYDWRQPVKMVTNIALTLIPIIPLEMGFRALNAAVDSLHHKVWTNYAESSGLKKAGWGVLGALCTFAKACARVTDSLIVDSANGLRRFCNAAPHVALPLQAVVDAHNTSQEKNSLMAGAKQFFSTWGSAIKASLTGLFSASKPAFIAATFGASAPAGMALSTVLSAASPLTYVPVVGPAVAPVLSAAASAPVTAGAYLPGLAAGAVGATKAAGIAYAVASAQTAGVATASVGTMAVHMHAAGEARAAKQAAKQQAEAACQSREDSDLSDTPSPLPSGSSGNSSENESPREKLTDAQALAVGRRYSLTGTGSRKHSASEGPLYVPEL